MRNTYIILFQPSCSYYTSEAVEVVKESKKNKSIYFYTYVPTLHSLYRELVDYPPEGYEYNYHDKRTAPIYSINQNVSILNSLYRKVIRRFVNTFAIKEVLYKHLPIPSDTCLIHSAGLLVRKNFPWVVDMIEHVTSFVGYDVKRLDQRKKEIEKLLGGDNCKKIMPFLEVSKRTLLENLDCLSFAHKIEVVHQAVHPKDFHKVHDDSSVRLLYVGSSNLPTHFYSKGGHLVFEAFRKLINRHKNVELVARTWVPPEIKHEFGSMDNVTIYDEVISWNEMEKIFMSSDIFVFPTHTTPGQMFLDAMSYELPIVTTDVWGNSEIVQDGKNGLLVKASDDVPYYTRGFIPNTESQEFINAIQKVDPALVDDLVEKLTTLIEDRSLRQKMGEEGRRIVEDGDFSIKARNRKLKQIYDEALK